MKIVGTKRRGHPSRCTPELIANLLEGIRQGLPISHACRSVSISPQIFCGWVRKLPALARQLEEAKSAFARHHLQRIREASDRGDWRASSWLLEHCMPQDFAKNRLEISGSVDHTHTLAISKETLDAISQARQRHEKKIITIPASAA